ncbi:MAG: hypothetical protein CMK59_08655 [Proteobacteria bacterium]|nr:hypothetical protein [Pseudomonadota bacterium]
MSESAFSGDLVAPQLSTDFFVWLWFSSERGKGIVELEEADQPADGGRISIDYFVDDRLVFCNPDAESMKAVITGENTAGALEAKAALSAGKVIQEIRLHMTVDEVEYGVTLKGPFLDLSGLKLPSLSLDGDAGGDDRGTLLIRMSQYEEVWGYIGTLYRHFAKIRTGPDWQDQYAQIKKWLSEI